MIPEITFKDFVNNLFGFTKIPLKERDWITAHKDNNLTYAYTWGEIEDYIVRWLNRVSISKLDVEINTAYKEMERIVNEWYLLNFEHKGGRSGYEDELKTFVIYDFEDFELHTKVREYIFLKAEEIKKEAEAKQREEEEAKQIEPQEGKEKEFEEFLECEEVLKKSIIEKMETLFSSIDRDAKKQNQEKVYVVIRALEELTYLDGYSRKPEAFYMALRKRFNLTFGQQNYNSNNSVETESKQTPKVVRRKEEIEHYKIIFVQ